MTTTTTEASIREGLSPQELEYRLAMLERVAATHASIQAATAGHQPGQPYQLTLEQFAAWCGINLPEPERGPTGEPTHYGIRATRSALWGAIAAREAGRWFAEDRRCTSSLFMDSNNGRMEWCYVTTSSTILHAIDWREDSDRAQAHYSVTIPAERDQPGRYAWCMVRLALAGLSEADVLSVEPREGLPPMNQAVATWLQHDLLELRGDT